MLKTNSSNVLPEAIHMPVAQSCYMFPYPSVSLSNFPQCQITSTTNDFVLCSYQQPRPIPFRNPEPWEDQLTTQHQSNSKTW